MKGKRASSFSIGKMRKKKPLIGIDLLSDIASQWRRTGRKRFIRFFFSLLMELMKIIFDQKDLMLS